MANDIIFIDEFSVGIDELPARKQRSTREVLRVLKETGRFSVFEATANETIAKTVDRIIRKKLVTTDISGGYPWTKVELTEAGRQYIGS